MEVNGRLNYLKDNENIVSMESNGINTMDFSVSVLTGGGGREGV